nr:anaerobic ribonucleoside-triphosphate reductase [Acutalibacter muris]
MTKNANKVIGEGKDFERIRRITGYLTGTLDGWNSAKRAEEKDRVKHPVNTNRRE